jgi:hypothetical protein
MLITISSESRLPSPESPKMSYTEPVAGMGV